MSKGRRAKKSGKTGIHFFGTNNSAWIDDHQIKDYETHKEICSAACKSVPFKEALTAIEEYKQKWEAGEVPPEEDLTRESATGEEAEGEAVTPSEPKTPGKVCNSSNQKHL